MKRLPLSCPPPISLFICLPTGIVGLERAGVSLITFWREPDTAMRPVERAGLC